MSEYQFMFIFSLSLDPGIFSWIRRITESGNTIRSGEFHITTGKQFIYNPGFICISGSKISVDLSDIKNKNHLIKNISEIRNAFQNIETEYNYLRLEISKIRISLEIYLYISKEFYIWIRNHTPVGQFQWDGETLVLDFRFKGKSVNLSAIVPETDPVYTKIDALQKIISGLDREYTRKLLTQSEN